MTSNDNFQINNDCDIELSFAQHIDCGYTLELGGSNEYPQSMILIKNKKDNVYPCKPQFYLIKVWCQWGLHYKDMLSI